MQIGLVDYEPAELFSDDIKELEELYIFYKEACEDLKSLINSNLDINEYWDIIDRYYNIELFESENDTIMDCHKLGIKPKRLLTDEAWNQSYMGEDGQMTMFIDLVKNTYSTSSTTPEEERKPLLDDIKPMFDDIRNINKDKVGL